MKKYHLSILAQGIFAAAAITLALGLSAQTTPAPAPTAAPKSPHTTPMSGHPKDAATAVKHEADMKTECEAMMAKKKEMQDKCKTMDETLDKLVAEMNAAKLSKDDDALEKPMAAVITELVAQHKAQHAMMMEMQPEMMKHMMHHMHMHGTKGAMECSMMKTEKAAEAKAAEKKQ